jgi:putative NADH-flavin reductase
MRIAIFGANGATGRLLTERCLAAGHTVTALLRSPEAFPYRDRVTVIQGSAFDYDAVARTINGAEIVFTALGAKSPLRNENVLPRAVPLIVKAMQKSGVDGTPPTRRIIALGSAGALPDSLSKQPAWQRWLIQNILYTYLLKWPVHEQIVQHLALLSSGLDWTMVMPPRLTNFRARSSYRIDGEALPAHGSRISRADVADFMMQQIESTAWLRRGVYIAD